NPAFLRYSEFRWAGVVSQILSTRLGSVPPCQRPGFWYRESGIWSWEARWCAVEAVPIARGPQSRCFLSSIEGVRGVGHGFSEERRYVRPEAAALGRAGARGNDRRHPRAAGTGS